MQRVRTATAAVSLPAYVSGGTPGFFSDGGAGAGDGTIPGQDWFNMIQEELCNLVVALGGTLDYSDDEQLATLLDGVNAILSHATAATNLTTEHQRAIIAATSSSASGDGSASVAGTDCNASGDNAAAIASNISVASGNQSAAIASGASEASGTMSVIAGATSSNATANNSGVLAANGCDADGAQSAVVASENSLADGASSAAIACGDASGGMDVGKKIAAAIGSSDGFVSPNTYGHSVLLGSVNAELHDDFTVAIGYSASGITETGANQNLTIRLRGDTGQGYAAAWNVGGADLAEFFPNADGAAHGPGLILAGAGEGVRVARPGDRARGVVSACPGLVANAASEQWAGRFKLDEWGRRIPEGDWFAVADGYNPGEQYVPRSDRPDEWTAVALTGQVPVRVDETVRPGDMVSAGLAGVGTREGDWRRGSRPIECLSIRSPFDAGRGYAIAWCLVG